MKIRIVLLSCLMLSGCVAVMVQKEVQVKKDANGKVIETIEIERAIQQATTIKGFQFDHLKSKESDTQPAALYGQ